jgi:hypothetical protein
LSRPGPTPARRPDWFKRLRIAVLVVILGLVSLGTWLDRYRSTRWRQPLFVAIYPIAADDSPVTRRYLDSLDAGQFKAIDAFFAREAARYHLRTQEPIRTRLHRELTVSPPQRDPRDGLIYTAYWSLKLRYWAWSVSRDSREPQDVRVFVLYHDPALNPSLPHSLGLTKGLIGVVYAFADPPMTGANNIVISHEMLHTLGATDKYDPVDDAPRFPEGYGDPLQSPLYPQKYAELMAGRRMLAPGQFQQPLSLDQVDVGRETALEIRWPQNAH